MKVLLKIKKTGGFGELILLIGEFNENLQSEMAGMEMPADDLGC